VQVLIRKVRHATRREEILILEDIRKAILRADRLDDIYNGVVGQGEQNEAGSLSREDGQVNVFSSRLAVVLESAGFERGSPESHTLNRGTFDLASPNSTLHILASSSSHLYMLLLRDNTYNVLLAFA